MPPSIGESLPETGEGRDETGDKDGTTAAEPLVHRFCKPATDYGAAEIWSRVCQAKEPGVSLSLSSDAELLFVEGLGAIDNSLVHTLDDGAE